MGEHVIYMGIDSYELLNAIFSEDEEKEKEIRARVDASLKKSLERDYEKLSGILGSEFDIFKNIDTKYERSHNTNAASVYGGDCYYYEWRTEFKVKTRYDEEFLRIGFRKGKYCLFAWYCDDSGYDQGVENILENIEPKDIENELLNFNKNQ